MSGNWALVPVKSFEEGKSRLSEIMDQDARTRFARELFDHVMEVLLASSALEGVAVVTASNEVREHAQKLGATVIEETQSNGGLAAIVDAGLVEVEKLGAKSAIVCVADLPTLSSNDVDRVTRYLEDADVVLVPDLEQEGTNLLGLSPPTCLATCFGHLDSFDRHQRAAREAGLMVHVHFNRGLGFDVDDEKDYKRYSENPPPNTTD